MAAGLVEVWSTIRLLITRGCVVEHEALLLRVRRARDGAAAGTEEIGRAGLRRAEDRRRQARERLVGGRELVSAREQVVAGAVDRAQAVAREPVRDLVCVRADQCLAIHRIADRIGVDRSARIGIALERARMALGDLDLFEDEREVGRGDRKPLADRCDRCLGHVALAGRRQGGGGRADGDRQDGVGRRPHQQTPARPPASRGFRPQYPAAPETRSVHNSPPQSDEMGCRIPPRGETAHPTIQARTLRNLLVFRRKSRDARERVNRRN